MTIYDYVSIGLTFGMFVAGAIVTVFPPETKKGKGVWLMAFIGLGLVSVVLQVIQGRSDSAARSEADERIASVQDDMKSARTEISQAQKLAEIEAERRKQAEKDLALFIQGTAQATRTGVAEDIRKSPITVAIDGQPSSVTAEERMKRIEARDRALASLSMFLVEANQLEILCIQESGSQMVSSQFIAWDNKVATFISNNIGPDVAIRFKNSMGNGLQIAYPADGAPVVLLGRIRGRRTFIDNLMREVRVANPN